MKDRLPVTRALALLVSLTGILVMLGWVLEISVLKSIHPDWIAMRFATALCFFFSGITLYFVCEAVRSHSDTAQVVLPATTLLILLLMATLLVSSLVGVRTGLEDLFIPEGPGAAVTTNPGPPSVGAMLGFILIATAGLLTLMQAKWVAAWLRRTGIAIMFIGMIALLGYLTNTPILYYVIEGWSTAMALHAALLFIALGSGFVIMCAKKVGAS